MKDKTTIFYVDDDEDDLVVFQEAISSFGHIPALFLDGYELLANLEESDPQKGIVFVDLNMPAISGYDLIKAIRNSVKFSKVPIISYSTAKDSMSVAKSKEAGANLHVPKANSFEGLKKSLEYVLSIDWETFHPENGQFIYNPE